MYLNELCSGRNNNLNIIRAIAATAVLVSHAYPISLGAGTPEPLTQISGYSLGAISVYVFFVISGFLITQSFDRASSWRSFLVARVLRLMPGLFVSLFVVGIVVGPLITTWSLSAYFMDPQFLRFMIGNSSLIFMQYELPGVFEELPYRAIVGSIWTLFYEVFCYASIFLLGLFGLIRRPVATSCILVILLAASLMSHLYAIEMQGRLEKIQDLTVPFIFGMLAYLWRKYVPMVWWLLPLAVVLPVAAFQTASYHLALCLSLAYLTLWLAYIPKGTIRRFNEIGDYSYGIYIYAFPVQGLAVYLIGPQSPMQNILYSLPPTVLLGVVSWYFVEKPAMAQKENITGWVTAGHNNLKNAMHRFFN